MSLRRSPRRTPAFLAANRANAQKSTGPRTALDRALCAGSEGQKLVGLATAMVWSVRRYAERHLRTLPPEKRRLLGDRRVPVARCWRRAIPTRGWKVTVTVLARHGRCRRCDLSSIPAVGAIRMPEDRPARVHVVTKVTCTGHPLFNRGPEGVPLSAKPGPNPSEIRAETRANPECVTKQGGYQNISSNADSPNADFPGVAGPRPAYGSQGAGGIEQTPGTVIDHPRPLLSRRGL